ncbi:MAG: DNA-3-methyladenine glycosylase I [Nanoarchaeota archaeon]|nr:DNA-3-methyladenine glycosylase I [Nanoarchaeota archaeon]
MERCDWPGKNPLMIKYHDEEWGVPLHDDKKLYEFLLLDAFQAGLSWEIVLNKRENFRKAFNNFDFYKIAKYNETKIKSLLNNQGIIRNQLKIKSTIQNAKAFIEIIKEFGSFDKYIWSFVTKPIQNSHKNIKDLPPKTELSDKISIDLKKRGMNFVGSTIIYAFMQAIGMVNDHQVKCFRYKQLFNTIPTIST